jgi:hypothetical protein
MTLEMDALMRILTPILAKRLPRCKNTDYYLLSGVNYPGRINDNYPGRFWLKKWVTFLGFVFFDNFLLLFQLWWRDE